MTYILTILGLLLAFWSGNKVCFQVRSDIEAELPLTDILDRFYLDLLERPFHVSFHEIDAAVGLCLAAAIGLSALYQKTMKGTRRDGAEHGSARFATQAAIRPYRDKTYTNNLLFTRTERLSLDGRKTQRNLNALVVGGSGSGKSRYYVLPNLAQFNTSFAVTDPKGELYAQTRSHLEAAGYKVRCFNLVDFNLSANFNPLSYFKDARGEIDISILVENFISNTTGRKPATSSDFWEKAERALLTALVAYIYYTKGNTGTLIDIVDLLAQMQAFEKEDESKSDVDLLFEATSELFQEAEIARQDPTQDIFSPEALAAIDGLRFAASQYNTYLQGAGETKKSVIISLGVRCAPLHMAPMRTLLSTDTLHLERIGLEKTALFLIIPDTHAAFNFLASIFFEQLFETNIYIADHEASRRLPVQLQVFMDEFANIGRIPSFERKIAVMRSRAISVSVIVQNMAQGKALYKEDWDTIVGNCDSILFLGGQERSTTEYFSKMLGKQTITTTDVSESRGRNGNWTRGHKRLGRELMTPDEIAHMRADYCLYFLRGLDPFYSKKLEAPNV